MINEEEERFSENPEEHLKIENEFLKLKLKAQYGENFQMFHGDDPLPVEIENQILKKLINIESEIQDGEQITIREKIAVGGFKPASELTEEEMKIINAEINEKLKQNGIDMFFMYGDNKTADIYSFLTGDLLDLNVEKFPLPDKTACFVYEDFRPNHKVLLLENTQTLASLWQLQAHKELNEVFNENITIYPELTATKAELLSKAANFFDSFRQLQIVALNIVEDDHDFSTLKEYDKILVTGKIILTATLENHEQITIEENIQVQYSFEANHWEIAAINLPGLH